MHTLHEEGVWRQVSQPGIIRKDLLLCRFSLGGGLVFVLARGQLAGEAHSAQTKLLSEGTLAALPLCPPLLHGNRPQKAAARQYPVVRRPQALHAWL